MRRVVRKRFIFAVPICFCLLLLLDWTGVTDGGFPSTWSVALVQVGANIAWTAFFTVIFYFGGSYLGKRYPP
jgi:hypothetical protein